MSEKNGDASEDQPIEASVIIPVRNGASTIAAQLHALAAQRDVEFAWEIVVSDNGSTDDTRAVIARMSKSMPAPVRVIDSGARPGLSHARNVGVENARGEFVVFCDCDDLVRPYWLTSAVRGLRAADIVGGEIYPFADPSQLGVEPSRGMIAATFGLAVIGCNFGARRAAYIHIGGCDESLPPYGCEDAEFSLRANKAKLHVATAAGMEIDFRRTVGVRSNIRKAYLSGIAETIVFTRHSDKYSAHSGVRSAMKRLCTIPLGEFQRWRRTGQLGAQSFARQMISAFGFLIGTMFHVSDRRLGPPMLMEAAE